VLEARRAGSPEPVLFVKVLPPPAAARLRALHETLGAALPVARCLACSEERGVLVLEALPGSTLGAALAAGSAPPPGDLLGLLETLAGHRGQPTTAAKMRSHTRLLRQLVPEESGALDRIAALYGDERAQPPATVHGDFHDGQVLAHAGRVSGLLDLDDVGPGQVVDDMALLLARMRARADRGQERADGYERELRAAFATAVDPGELARRAAGALLGRATAPFRVQSPDWPVATRERIRATLLALECGGWDSNPQALAGNGF
jgi:plasmid stabilization system protein ParE